MAVTLTAGQAAVAIRAATDADAVDPRVLFVVETAFAAAQACVVDFAPGAPDAIHNAAAIRVTGWLYDAEPTDPAASRVLAVSGAQALLAPYRTHRAGAVGAASQTPGPAPEPSGGALPPVPGPGTWVLVNDNGVEKWVAFPLPPG